MQMEVLPDPIMHAGEPVIIVCPKCGAINIGGRPHGQEPCPFAVVEMHANTEMLEAQKAYYERAGFMSNDVSAMMQKMMGDLGRLGLDDDPS